MSMIDRIESRVESEIENSALFDAGRPPKKVVDDAIGVLTRTVFKSDESLIDLDATGELTGVRYNIPAIVRGVVELGAGIYVGDILGVIVALSGLSEISRIKTTLTPTSVGIVVSLFRVDAQEMRRDDLIKASTDFLKSRIDTVPSEVDVCREIRVLEEMGVLESDGALIRLVEICHE
jgi:hypothetical protein